MRQELGGAEAVHEFLVDVELQVGDAVADAVDVFQKINRSECQGRTAQGAVSQRFVAFQGQVRQHADGNGRAWVDEGAEGTADKK